MKEHIKRAVQKLLVQKRHRLYEERVAGQAVPHAIWLKRTVGQERAEILSWSAGRGKERLSVSVFSGEEFCEAVLHKKVQAETGALWLVTSDSEALTEGAASEAVRYFEEHPACRIAYGDEDRYLKPGWSPDLLQSFFYFGNLFVVRKELIEKISGKAQERERLVAETGGKEQERERLIAETAGKAAARGGLSRPETREGSESEKTELRKKIYDIVLCCIDEAKEAGHIEKIMFLSGKTEERKANPAGEEKEQPGGEAAWQEKYGDWGMEAAFDELKKGHLYADAEISAEKAWQDLVSVIIPSKDNPAMLSRCIHSLREQTDYQNMEIIVIDNGSNGKNKERILQMRDQLKEAYSFRYLYRQMAFNFSAMCNIGAKEAGGKYLLFLNDDMEVAQEDWLGLMVAKAAKPYVGAVGAKLLYPDSDRIQHLGITNIHLGPAHKLQFSSDKEVHYHGINRCAVNVAAVTGACLLLRREVFEEIGGFEEKLQVAFNDVELCFRLLRAGYRNVCCNQTYLCHHESFSRGFDAGREKVARLHRERDFLYEAYPEMWNRDAYYSGKLVRDILDRGFEPACRFEERRLSERAEVIPLENGPDPVWHNECLYMGVEFTGDEKAWKTGKSGGGDYYVQGWSYAVNVDNSRYERSLLLKPLQETEGQAVRMWKVPYRECYRPDMEENLPYIDHPALCGVSLWIRRDALPAGEYLIGYFWEDTCSRQKLYGFSAETLVVDDLRK